MQRQAESEIMNIPASVDAYVKADFAQVNQAFVDRLLELSGPREQAIAIDLGTGPADIPIRLARRRPHWNITALDASQAMLVAAQVAIERAGLSAAIKPVLADAKNSPLPSATFDIIFSNSILHHVSDTKQFWRELRRLGKPGALVLIRDLVRPRNTQHARELVWQYAGDESALLQEEFYNSLLAAYSIEEIRGQIQEADLQILQTREASDRHLDVYGTIL